jgi:glycosyltransferase involved in cell wall biosynthesis
VKYDIITVDTLTRSITVVIPAYNEEKRLAATLEQVLSYLDRGDWAFAEVLVVDDGSRDSTAALAERFGGADARVRVLRNPGNRGKGYSVRHGMLEARGEWVLFTDADLSTPIEELDRLIGAAGARQASVVIGSRALDRSLIGVHQSLFRENAGRLFNLCMRIITGLPFADTQCGFKLFERSAAQQIFRRQRLDRFGFDPEVLFIARRLGYRIAEVPVRWNNAEGTKVTLLGGLTPFLDLLRIRWNQLRGRYDWTGSQ